MSSQNCNLIFTGRFVDDIEIETIHKNLADIFKTDIEKIQLKFSNRPSIIKSNADKTMCLKMQQVLLTAGAYCDIEDIPSENLSNLAEDEVAQPPTPHTETTANPYAVPQSELRTQNNSAADNFEGPLKVSASNGIAWVGGAIGLFLKSPFMWMLAMLVYMIVNLIQIIPLIGPIIVLFLNPILIGGFMHGARDLDMDDTPLSPGCVFKGFSNNGTQLFLLGLLLFGFFLILGFSLGIGFAVFGKDFINFANPGAMSSMPDIKIFILIGLLIMLFCFPIMMCYWFAPALITLNNKPVFEAIKLSFSASIKNFVPFIVFSLVFIAIYAVFIIIVIAILAAATTLLGKSSGIAIALSVIVMVVFIFSFFPIAVLTMYTSYKNIFYNN